MDAQRIRVFFSDPDATDSDSGDDPSSAGSFAATKSAAAGKTQILILHGNSAMSKKNPSGFGCGRAPATIGSPAAASIGKRAAVMSSDAPARRHRGVYERQPGRWAAEFRSHRLKVRHWVGTFATEAAAKAAYDAFEREFLSSPSPRCGRLPPPPAASDGNGGGVRRAPRPPAVDKRQIVLALAAAAIPAAARMRRPACAAAAPCVSSSTSAGATAAPCVSSSASASPPPAALFEDAARSQPSIHSFWADDPDDLIGLADLSHLPLPFSRGASMEFDPADLELFDNGFL
ncbi:unnamed protein product [Urochloa decumbens]|uniref:AP2/ERF domain-containing protein n=1 Tax=Urochloa decumbens TaxID=240449 RepID=A0ABC9C012_9POAL